MEIKTNSLRVGNLLNHEQYGIVRVEGIHWNHRSVFCGRNQISDAKNWQEIDRFKCIPLSEEILLKCGFVKLTELNINYRYLYKDFLAYDIDDNCVRVYDTWEFGKRLYLHEIQNLIFALTNTELEINL